MREPYQFKVGYRSVRGFLLTAYLDEREGDIAWGTEKHTDEPVILRWIGDEWHEVTND